MQECNIEEVSDEGEPAPKSSKDKKSNGPDSSKVNLVFKITSRVPYKTVLKGKLSFWYMPIFLKFLKMF